MNSFVMKNTFSSKIVILDRYIYDLWAKDKVKSELSYFTISFVYNIFCRIVKFPTKAYFIYDKPENIYKRKKELTENQISFFQIYLTTVFKKIRVSFKKVFVKNNKPNEIAKRILEDIIKKNPDLIISIVKQNTKFKAL
jgi:thymidylate kinase